MLTGDAGLYQAGDLSRASSDLKIKTKGIHFSNVSGDYQMGIKSFNSFSARPAADEDKENLKEDKKTTAKAAKKVIKPTENKLH